MAALRIPKKFSIEEALRSTVHPVTGVRRAGFENVDQCKVEDEFRAMSLKARASGILPIGPDASHIEVDAQHASDLTGRLWARQSGTPQRTLASSLFMRKLRRTILTPILQLIDQHPNMIVRTFTMIHPSWAFSASELSNVDARQAENQFRTHLNRGGVTMAPGFLLTFLHGEFEPISQEFQLHFHGICGGEKVRALDGMRQHQGYARTPTIYRPLVISPVRDPARQVW